jgi:hypothetical protein
MLKAWMSNLYTQSLSSYCRHSGPIQAINPAGYTTDGLLETASPLIHSREFLSDVIDRTGEDELILGREIDNIRELLDVEPDAKCELSRTW